MADPYEGFHAWAGARRGALSRAAYLLTGDDHAAEELVQAVLVEAARHWPQIKVNPEPYARRIMYTRNIDRWRSRRSKEISFEHVPDEARGDDSSIDCDRRLVLHQALNRLTAKQRAVLILRFYEDQSESYTADVLNCSVGTVKSQTRHALKRIRELAPDLLTDFEPHPASDRRDRP